MKLTEEIREAIRKAAEREGNPFAFSKKLEGIKQTTVRNWIIGKTNSISDANWEKLYPFIRGYLPYNETTKHLERDWSGVDPIQLISSSPAANGMREEPVDAALEILKREAKLAQYVLQIAYLERKVKRLQELNFKEGAENIQSCSSQRTGIDLFWQLFYAFYLNPNKLSIIEAYWMAKKKVQEDNPDAIIPTADHVRYQLKKLDCEVINLARK